jgi:hypothetical protein
MFCLYVYRSRDFTFEIFCRETIPIRGQYEQQCNAAGLKEMGVLCLKNAEDDFKNNFYNWILSDHIIQADYSNSVSQCLEYLFSKREMENETVSGNSAFLNFIL